MRFSSFSSAFVSAVVGFGGTLALLLAAANALGATSAQTASWVTAITFVVGLESLLLCLYFRQPILTAWSSAGLALIGATSGFDMQDAVAAFIVTGFLLVLTGIFRPLSKLVAQIPAGVSAGMLAGVMLPFVLDGARSAGIDPSLVLTLAAIFFLIRLWNPSLAVISVLLMGIFYAFVTGQTTEPFALEISTLTVIAPVFSWTGIFGIAIPLYLVTMASQNLPGLAVLRASGYQPPVGAPIALTGLFSAISAPFGASTTNLSAITAAICTGEESHPDPAKRWHVGIWYCLLYFCFAVFGASLIRLVAIMPPALIALVLGLALLAPLSNALMIAMKQENERIAAMTTFAVTASGLAFFGVGSAFWGLVAGLMVYFSMALKR